MTQRRDGERLPYNRGLIVLIGGTTGTGKSTVASEVAHRLGITRVTSTDFIRETMRAFFSYDEMPAVHHSSFEAWTAVEGGEDPLIAGFVEQCGLVCVGVDAAIRRSLTEGWSVVLEGVHLVPGMVPAFLEGALILHVIVEISDENAHRMHFHVRDRATGGVRAMDKYLDRIDDIRRIQTFLVDCAQREGVEVVENTNVEQAIDAVITLAMELTDPVGRPA